MVGPSKAPVLAHEPRFEMCGVDDRCESSGHWAWRRVIASGRRRLIQRLVRTHEIALRAELIKASLLAAERAGCGAGGFLLFAPEAAVPVAKLPEDPVFQQENWSVALGVGLAVWAVWEITRMWRRRTGSMSIGARIFSKHYSLSMAAILIGVSNAVLYTIYGTWAYTSVLNGGIKQLLGDFGPIGPIYWILFVSLFLGMTISAWQSRTFALEWRPALSWMQQFLGGVLMGLGVAMVPGGNDVLILNGIPSLSPHAMPAYLAVIAGIAVTLLVIRWTGGTIETIDCSGDVCIIRK